MNENKNGQFNSNKVSSNKSIITQYNQLSEIDNDLENMYSLNDRMVYQPESKEQKRKNATAIIIAIAVVILMIVILVVVLMTRGKEEEKPQESNSNTEEKEEEKGITLEDIASKIDTTALSELGFEVSIEEDNLVLSTLVKEVPYNFVFRIEKDVLSLELEEETEMAHQVWALVLDALGQCNGNEAGDVLKYLSLVENPAEVYEKVEEDQILWRVSTKTKFDTSRLEEYPLTVEDLEKIKTSLEGEKSYAYSKGYMELYKEEGKETLVVLFAEKKNSSGLTYPSILAFINTIYPGEYSMFKEQFTELESASFGRYKIETDVTLTESETEAMDAFRSNYQFIRLTIDTTV